MTALPSGIVTFLFVDIEGSTRLMHRLRDRYAEVLDRYRNHIESATLDHDGHVVSYLGDGAFLAFASPDDAIETAVQVQSRLAGEPWPDGVRLRARAGIHSGLASPRHGDYVAVAVHQASRVMGAAHGGQVLVSDATAELLPGRSDLETVGRFRLRDFDHPVELHRVAGPWPMPDFPPRAVPAGRHNLVAPVTPTVGRQDLVSELLDEVQPGTVTTLVGPGGVGKTRVAVDVGLALADRWPDGSWMVSLAEIPDDGQVLHAVERALGLQGTAEGPDALLDHLASRRLVLILDNCEHVTEGVRELLGWLRSPGPGPAVLATSRRALRDPAERVRRVAPLASVDADEADAASVRSSPAGELFAQRASSLASFEIDPANAPTVAALCKRLDGIPLLIELAAAQIAYRSLDEVLSGVEESIVSLSDPGRRDEGRHLTADAVIEWSYRLLDADEQAAFRRFSAFGAGFTLELAEVAIGADLARRAPELLWSLLDQSLLVDDRSANETRYAMLGPIREWGRLRATRAGDLTSSALALAEEYLEHLGPWLPDDRTWVGVVAQERPNLQAILPVVASVDQDRAQLLACVLGRYDNASQAYTRGVEEVEQLAAELTAPTQTRVSLLAMLADLHLRLGHVAQAGTVLEEASALAESVGQPPWDEVAVERAKGEAALRSGRLDEAMSIARAKLQDRGLSPRGQSRMYNVLGIAAIAAGDLEIALEAFEGELRASSEAGRVYVASAHGNIAEVAMRLGDIRRAAHHQAICLRVAEERGDAAMVAFSLILAARLAAREQAWPTAIRLQSKADVLLDEIGLALFEDDIAQIDGTMAEAFAEVGRTDYRRLEDEGRSGDVGALAGEAEQILDAAAGRDDGRGGT